MNWMDIRRRMESVQVEVGNRTTALLWIGTMISATRHKHGTAKSGVSRDQSNWT